MTRAGSVDLSTVKRMMRGLPVALLVAGIAVSAVLQATRVVALNSISHDDGISYLAATAHQASYARSMPAGAWVQAAEWKQYWQLEQLFPFRTIGADLASYDVHPPLYFWLLNIWLTVFGTDNLAVGPLLNVVFLVIAYVLLFALGRRVLRSDLWACFLVLIWAFSPVTLKVTVETRPYALALVWSILLTLLIVLWWEGKSTRSTLAGIALCTAGGLLTHYQFLVIMAGLAFLTVMQALVQRNVKRSVPVLLAMMVGIGVFVVLHPQFMDSVRSLSRQVQSGPACDMVEIESRLLKTKKNLRAFFPPEITQLAWPVAVVGVILILFATIISRERTEGYRDTLSRILRHPLTYIVCLGLFLTIAISLQYVTCRSPRHAMGAKYLTMAFVLLAFVPFALLSGMKRWLASALLAVLLLLQLGYGVRDTIENYEQMRSERESTVPLNTATSILLDTTARGVVPRIFWHVPETTKVFAAYQDDLIEKPEPFLGGMAPGSVYISELTYGDNSAAKREQVLKLLRQAGLTPQLRESGVFGDVELYDIMQSSAP